MDSLPILYFIKDKDLEKDTPIKIHFDTTPTYTSTLTTKPIETQEMPHANKHADFPHRNPEEVNAYLVGGGIASLAAAVHLIQDAKVPAKQIHILESSPIPGGSMDGAGSAEKGYVLRGGRMLNFSYGCTYHLLSKIPSLTDANKTVKQELDEFNAVPGNKTHARARLVASAVETEEKDVEGKPEKKVVVEPVIMDVSKMGFHAQDRKDLLYVAAASEKTLGEKRIDECFRKEFFDTPFWYMWDTTFAFEPWHSAVEFKRYLHRFIQEFPRINTLSGVDRTPYNQFDSIILPIETYLKNQGVDFRYDNKVTSVSFAPQPDIEVSELHITSKAGGTGLIHVHPHDLVFLTLGSMTACSSLGTNTTPPTPLPLPETALAAPDGSWKLWASLTNPGTNPHHAEFGNPANFYTRVPESNWLSFTVTLKDSDFLSLYEKWSGNAPGTGALVTFKDSKWLMSIVVPHQPHYIDQPENVHVFWGYGLFPARHGNFVHKPMEECSGAEILTELLAHLNFPKEKILQQAITIPCMMPFITSQFLTRKHSDRPAVIPRGSKNLALMGQYVEIEGDTVFTVEYSVRAAQMAVHEFMETKEKPVPIYRGDHSPKVLVEALRMLIT